MNVQELNKELYSVLTSSIVLIKKKLKPTGYQAIHFLSDSKDRKKVLKGARSMTRKPVGPTVAAHVTMVLT